MEVKQMKTWFNSLPRLVQVILLLIPVCNWVVELLVRWSHFAERKGLISLILAILTIPGGVLFGWLDVVWSLLFNHLFLAR